MSRIFFAWELGQNYGHLSRQLAIVKKLQARGHAVFFAVRDCGVAAELLSPLDIPYTQAPFWHAGKMLSAPPKNYAELLLAEGYGSRLGLQGMVNSWVNLYRLYRPDIIVIDHSPTALLASCMLDIPAIQIGHGFAIPPNVRPFPSIRPWETMTKTRLLQAEMRILESLNSICVLYRKPGFESLQALMKYGVRLLASFPELDHYGSRIDETYIGPIYTASRGLIIPWRESSLPHIFAYLRPSVPGFSALLHALGDLTQIAGVTLVAPGISRTQREGIASKRMQIYSQAIRLDHICNKVALAVTYGNIGTVSQFLLAGVPTLLVPQNVEQYLFSKRVECLGAGLMVNQLRSKKDFTRLLQRLIQELEFRDRAIAFSERYVGYQPDKAVERVVQEIERLL